MLLFARAAYYLSGDAQQQSVLSASLPVDGAGCQGMPSCTGRILLLLLLLL
jgi:hypothetical protein